MLIRGKEGVDEEVALKLLRLQKVCIECESFFALDIHHRIFRSEGDAVLREFLLEQSRIYEDCYGRALETWFSIHDIQNLCVLCHNCHMDLHRGNEELRQKLRNSFTCPVTGFNINFFKDNLPY